ncbi:MAG: DUF4440 domain-containing protein [Pyrinomonadaceae bacterium]
MRAVPALFLILIVAAAAAAQRPVEQMVAAERAFAQAAAESGTRTAFLKFMSPDAVGFFPERSPARAYWSARPESASLLAWAPNFADISSNGILGYTTGNWEFRPKGKGDEPVAFGHFVTIWLRQPSGEFRWVLDIGVDHARPERYSTDIETAPGETAAASQRIGAADRANRFFVVAASQGVKKAYSEFAAKDVRVFREGAFPFTGKKQLLDLAGREKRSFAVAKRMVFFEADDLAYVTNRYSFAPNGKAAGESGNFLQVWKFRNGRWEIVLDLFKPVPAAEN